MEISDGLLDNPKQSDCLEQCAYDCSELDVDVTLAGLVKQPDADSQRTITITLRGDMDHTTVSSRGGPEQTAGVDRWTPGRKKRNT